MSIIDSSWFLSKLKMHNQKADMLTLFDVLAEALKEAHLADNPPFNPDRSGRAGLLTYLSQQAKVSGIKSPDLIAQQIYFMASNAAQQHQANPNSTALYHAKQAAFALIQVQSKPVWLQKSKEYLSLKPVAYGLATGAFATACFGIAMGYQAIHPNSSISNAYMAQAGETNTAPDSNLANPSDTAEMYAKIEKMRDGRCHYIEVLQLPEAQQGLYLQNVIAGQVSNKVNEQKVARELMEKVSCDYTPMLMKNSAG